MTHEIRGKDLIKLGYKQGPWISMAMEIVNKKLKHTPHEDKMSLLEDVLVNPENYREVEHWNKVVDKMYPPKSPTDLREQAVPVKIYGHSIIEEGALHQIYQAAKLPISYKAALMPDAHAGYGLPIGGVLATENAVIPYGVGVDIGCRMALTVYPLREFNSELEKIIEKYTLFGAGGAWQKSSNIRRKIDYSIMERDEFKTNSTIRHLKDKAYEQLGTSGSGNHFVEFGELNVTSNGNNFNLPTGKYLALLSHSGSRGLGANIAKYYTNIAKRLRKLDPTVSNLAWLMMDEAEGMEYWEAMNLAGDYAKACHDNIHMMIAKALNERPLAKIENHHNFAWKEIHDGIEVIVHRKGATPAGKGVMGIIPGSMATPGFIVEGLGNVDSLTSASHGAGRLMSRTQAKQSFVWNHVKSDLDNKNIKLMGGGLDEAMGAYKDINTVMSHQTELVNVLATFMPKIVRMAGSDEEPED